MMSDGNRRWGSWREEDEGVETEREDKSWSKRGEE